MSRVFSNGPGGWGSIPGRVIRKTQKMVLDTALLNTQCYIKYAMVFGSFLVTLCALISCHVVISKQDSMIRALRSNRCVTGRRPRDENHAVRFGQSTENHSRARDTQPIRGVSDELAKGCKHWQPLVPGR